VTAYDWAATGGYAPPKGFSGDRDDGLRDEYGTVGRVPRDYGVPGAAHTPMDSLTQFLQQSYERPAWLSVPPGAQRSAYAVDPLDDIVLRVIETYRMLDALFGRRPGDYAPPTPPQRRSAQRQP
jgi:hypothetical protein